MQARILVLRRTWTRFESSRRFSLTPSHHGPATNVQIVETRKIGSLPPNISDIAASEFDAMERVVRKVHRVGTDLRMHPSRHKDTILLEDFERWRDILLAPNMEAALKIWSDRSRDGLFHAVLGDGANVPSAHGEELLGPSLPTWVLIYLMSIKVYTPDHANMALALALRHLPSTEPQFQAPLLVLAARALAKQQTAPPLQTLVHSFLEIPLRRPSLQFNLLLRAMSHFHPSVGVAKLTTVVLDAMEARQLRLDGSTYRALLSNRLVTLELTKVLQARMIREGFTPKAAHLEAFLRVYGKHGLVHHAARYLNAIRSLKLEEGKTAPYGSDLTEEPGSRDGTTAPTRDNTAYLRAFARDRGSAFQYLRGLVDAEKEQSEDGDDPSLPIRPRKNLARPVLRPLRTWKRTVDHHDWTTLLHIASLDKTTSAPALLRLFERSKCTSFSPNTAAYTAVMRGLLKRRDFAAAHALWQELRRSKQVDKKALTLGVFVLVRAGHIPEAFATLEELVALPYMPVTVTRETQVTPRHKIQPDTILINSLMTALFHSARPDLVFLTWESMEAVYNVKPNGESLTVLLRAALSAAKFDNSLVAVWPHIKFHLKLHGEQSASESARAERNARIGAIKQQIGGDGTGKPPGKLTSFWGSVPAGRRARRVFRDVVLGNWPHLRDVEPPAVAVWSDAAQTHHPMRDMVKQVTGAAGAALSMIFPTSSSPTSRDVVHKTPDTVLAQVGLQPLGRYPQIVPNEKTFRAYIELLGSMEYASEIALTLAWMRALDVRPTRETLSVALVLWAGVSVRGPLLERWEGKSEYGKLVRWLREWLGQKDMPTDRKTERALKYLWRRKERV